MKPQKHAAQKHAWIDGATIEYMNCATKLWTRCRDNQPQWDEGTEYRASIAEVEGKPVFEGDVLYFDGTCVAAKFIAHKATEKCIVDKDGGCWSINRCSWNPPAPRTITVELLREDAESMVGFNPLDTLVKSHC